MIQQGFLYFFDSIEKDPITLLIIIPAILISFLSRRKDLAIVGVGTSIYLGYIIFIGGCFMSGRFFTAPLYVSLIIIGKEDFVKGKIFYIMLILALVIGLTNPVSPIKSSANYPAKGYTRGISDERSMYYSSTGLLRWNRYFDPPVHGWRDMGENDRGRKMTVNGHPGYYGFFVGPETYVLDNLGLNDPLISKIDAVVLEGEKKDMWRIGHYLRKFPAGYRETVESGENTITDPSLAKYYDKIHFITTGPLFSLERIEEIIKMNLGYYDHLVDNYSDKVRASSNS